MFKKLQFHHIGIATDDIEKSISLYEVLGYVSQGQRTVIDPIQKVELAFMFRENHPLIELVSPLDDNSPVRSILNKMRTTPYHTCYEIPIIEDAAEALGSYYKKKHVGTFGDIGVLSFNGNKIITTGGGGAILTNKKKLAKKIFNLATIYKKKHKWKYEYDNIGYNYRMPSLNAAIGIAQINKLNFYVNKKRALFLYK